MVSCKATSTAFEPYGKEWVQTVRHSPVLLCCLHISLSRVAIRIQCHYFGLHQAERRTIILVGLCLIWLHPWNFQSFQSIIHLLHRFSTSTWSDITKEQLSSLFRGPVTFHSKWIWNKVCSLNQVLLCLPA